MNRRWRSERDFETAPVSMHIKRIDRKKLPLSRSVLISQDTPMF